MGQNEGKLLSLAAGVALGALAAGLLFQALGRPSDRVIAAESPPSAGDAHSARAAAVLPAPRPQAQAEAQVASENAHSRVAVPVRELESPDEGLLAMFNAAYARGEIEDQHLVQVLFGLLIAKGDAEAALDLATRFAPHDAAMLVQVAGLFALQGDGARSKQAIERALALSPDNDWILNQYANLDAAGALPFYLARLAGQPPPGDSELRLEIARLYANTGNTLEARAQIQALLAQDPTDSSALELLSNFDPSAAERAVRSLIASGDSNNDWNGFLLQLVLQQDRPDDAVALLESRRAMGLMPESDEYGAVASQYLEQGKLDAAVAMWSNAFDSEQGDPDSWTSALQDYAPQKLLAMLEARTAQGANDEFWGALGDSYWRANRRDDALNAWREALRLDPQDDEWSGKVSAVAAGVDPL